MRDEKICAGGGAPPDDGGDDGDKGLEVRGERLRDSRVRVEALVGGALIHSGDLDLDAAEARAEFAAAVAAKCAARRGPGVVEAGEVEERLKAEAATEDGWRDAHAVDVDEVRRRVGEVVKAKDLPGLYRDRALLADLAAVKGVDRAAFAEMVALLRGVKGFSTRQLDDVMDVLRPGGGAGDTAADAETDAARLVRLGSEGVELFHDPAGMPYVWVTAAGRRECHPLRSRWFIKRVKRQFYEESRRTPSAETFKSALDILEFEADQGPCREVFVRRAEVADPDDPTRVVSFLDLADGSGQAVMMSRDGWQIVDDPSVPFLRPPGMLPLPQPERGGSLDELWGFLNLGLRDRVLVVAFVTACLRPRGPYTVLIVFGEQGSTKSTFCAVLRRLVDPHSAPLRNLPRDERDLLISAVHSGLLVFDNVSYLSETMSDALCRIATGSGFSTRRLFTDDEEVHFAAVRPVVVNGIEETASRGDLLQRALLVELPGIGGAARRTETSFWDEFQAAHPRLLGAVLDAVVGGLAALPKTTLERLPRMADFGLWGEAVCRALGLPPGEFLAAYEDNQARAEGLTLESSPVGTAILTLMADRPPWAGTAARLLSELGELVDSSQRRKGWPSSPKGMGSALRRVAPALRAHGIDVAFDRETDKGRTRLIMLTRSPASPAGDGG
jgi:hypothetical protein